MPLHLVTGRANAGKTGVVYRALESASRDGGPSTLLVPVAQDVWRAQRELAARGFLGVRVATLDAWMSQLWALFGDGRRLVGMTARTALMDEAVRSTSLEVLGPSSVHAGFSGLMAEVASRLVEPAPARGRPAIREVAAIVSAYEELLARRGLAETARVVHAAAADMPPQLGPIAIHRFTDFSAAQEAFIEALAQRSEVVLSLPWEESFPATEALTPIVERLAALADRTTHVPSAASEGALAAIEAEIYAPRRVHAPSEELVCAVAGGEEAESALAARLAAEAVERGVPAENIAIVFRDVGRRANLLGAALSAVELDFDLDTAPCFADTPFGRAFLGLLEACIEPSRERLLAWALSPYSGVGGDVVAKADVEWRSERLAGRRLLEAAEQLPAGAGQCVAWMRRLVAQGVQAENVNKWHSVVSSQLRAAERSRGLGGSEGALDASAHRTALSTLGEIAELGGIAVPAGRLLDILGRAPVGVGATERAGAVQVSDAHRIRGRRFDVVILGGLTADEFGVAGEEPMAARLLRELRAPSGTDELLSDRLLFYLLVSRARRQLVLLRQVTDSSGNAKRASAFWDEVVDLFHEPSAESAPEFPAGMRVVRLGQSDLAEIAPSYAPGRRGQRALPCAPRLPGHGQLVDRHVLEALAATHEFSVTELETYLQCPYGWFYERSVRPRELDREVDARERGSFAHRLLREFYQAWQERSGSPRVTSESLGRALDVLDETAVRVRARARMQATTLAEELGLAAAAGWARSIVEDDATFLPGYKPVAHELAFGSDTEHRIQIGDVQVRGFIDRVDQGPDGVVVIDYKSSRDVYGYRSFPTYGLLQAPVYATVAAQVLNAPVAGALYRSLRTLKARGFYLDEALCLDERGSRNDALSAAGVEELLGETAELVSRAALGIRSGDISPRPAKKTCAHCGARIVCGEAS